MASSGAASQDLGHRSSAVYATVRSRLARAVSAEAGNYSPCYARLSLGMCLKAANAHSHSRFTDLLGRSIVMRLIMFSQKLVVFSIAAAVQSKFKLAIRCGAAYASSCAITFESALALAIFSFPTSFHRKAVVSILGTTYRGI